MKPAPFKYYDPTSLQEVTSLLGSLEIVKLLAGGQSLGPMLNMRLVLPDHLVDLNKVGELAYIRESGDRLEIGAMARQRALERAPEVQRACPAMIEALHWVGHYQTRNRGTMGGSLSHLDPAAELPGICALYDAELSVAGPRGARQVGINDWGRGFMAPDLEPDEVLTRIALKPWRESHGHAFVEFTRRHGDFALAGVAALVAFDGNDKVSRAAIVVIGLSHAPIRLAAAERALVGTGLGEDEMRAVAGEVDQLEAFGDAHVSGAYRKRLGGVLLGRALRTAAERARRRGPQ